MNQNIPFIAAIFGNDDFSEVQKVKEVTAIFGIENHHIKLDESFTSNPWDSIKKDSILTSSEEEPGYLVGRIMHVRRHYLPLSTTAVNGVRGRFYKDGFWNEMYIINLYREPKSFIVDTFIKYRVLNKNHRDDIFSESYLDIKNQSRSYFSDMINRSISDSESSPVAIQVDIFDAEHYAAFGQVANTSCNYILDVMYPLLYRRNIEFAVTLISKRRFNLSRIQRGIV
jgi:hypothetical protein